MRLPEEMEGPQSWLTQGTGDRLTVKPKNKKKRFLLFQWKKEWEEEGNDVKDMGIITFKGPKKRTGLLLWDPRVFVSWLIKHKTAEPLKFNYEFKERELIENILVVNNLPKSKQQLWKENNNG